MATSASGAPNSASAGNSNSGRPEDICLGCEMDHLVAEVYSGNRLPFSPHQFLYSVWKHSNTFAGYEQQDAHEFLIQVCRRSRVSVCSTARQMLNGIHSHCGGTPASSCACVVHQIFGGLLRSVAARAALFVVGLIDWRAAPM